ncbi:acetylxylan esterase [Phragmitibacter flavus]|uniref:Acetylxylan esterase n=1 Tax=Phragmitibacter flavus TaxID=2576071 RepID=A0A5R8KJR2_9BACT|nr:acetylxylan esterase [Phragmitibacter flavus]TLD72563.1 acetylxylan esterase [Phragmitibacter flavus]
MRLLTLLSLFTTAASVSMPLAAQKPAFVPNYDEAQANFIAIPDVLTATDGSKITTREAWLAQRKPELLQLFATQVYGKTPEAEVPIRVETVGADKPILNGKGVMRQTILHIGPQGEVQAQILLFLPASTKEKSTPVPTFVTLNFWGNHSVSTDPDILLSTSWFRDNKEKHTVNNRATEASRGTGDDRFPIEAILDRGYAVATAYYGDFDPDFDDNFQNGIHPLFYRDGQTKPDPDQWGSIGAWAWGLSRMADYLITLPEIDQTKLAVLGHSRLGKAALWAGAQDERFTFVISNNSGAGGAALAKRIFGETVGRLNSAFPHWFCDNYNQYSLNEAALPMDQHALIALMAPRPVYIASATGDQWADPKGEFLGGKLAEPVYALFNLPGLGVEEQPAPDMPVGKTIGYHLRTGKHDITPYDWDRYMDFADQHWSASPK